MTNQKHLQKIEETQTEGGDARHVRKSLAETSRKLVEEERKRHEGYSGNPDHLPSEPADDDRPSDSSSETDA